MEKEIIENRKKYGNDIQGVHYIALEILKEFDKVCRNHNIEYWISDGTLLGAVRHRGFIPWDDDIDVCIKEEDKEKLIKILKEELPYYLLVTNDSGQNENLNYFKIRDRYSQVKEKENGYKQQGIWIDIFPMGRLENNNLINFFLSRIPSERIKEYDTNIKRIIRKLIWFFFKILKIKSRKTLTNIFYKKLSTKNKKLNSRIYTNGEIWWHTYKESWIFPLKEIEFEGYNFFCPNNYRDYLKSYYGKEYMKLPPKSKRVVHSINIDLCKANNHPESLEWEKREEHYKKWLDRERKINE